METRQLRSWSSTSINHPLDCPVCDQAGECWLQIYYMRHGLYDPRMADEKVHKPKAVPLGPHVILDAERCILCSRCVRFCDEVTGTGELGIFHRGDHSEIGLFPGKTLENKYSGNVIDICPVGALTDRDFRFQVRVWYLDTAKSVCNGCARGLQHRGPHQPAAPAPQPGQARGAASSRATMPTSTSGGSATRAATASAGSTTRAASPRPARRAGGQRRRRPPGTRRSPTSRAALRRYRPEEIGDPRLAPDVQRGPVRAAAPRSTSSAWPTVDHRVPPRDAGRGRRPPDPRRQESRTRAGAELIGPRPGAGGLDAAGILDGGAAARRIKLLWILHHDLLASGLPAADVTAALAGAEMVVFQGTKRERTERGGAPGAAERGLRRARGHLHQFPGARAALPHRAWSRSARRGRTGTILGRLGRAPGRRRTPRSPPTRADQVFLRSPAAVPAFAGMTYRALGDAGLVVKA